MSATLNPHFFWYLSRASGIVGWVLITAAVIWGVVLSTGVLRDRDRPAWVLDLHRMLGGLALAILAVHVAALLFDPVVPFSLADAFVPLASPWRPWAVAFGIIGLYLLILVEVSSFARRRMSLRMWRLVHMSAYVVALFGAIHAGLAGSDISNRIYQVGAIALIVLTCLAVVLRLLVSRQPPARKLRVHRRMDGDSSHHHLANGQVLTPPTTTVAPESKSAAPGTRRP